MNKEKNKSSFKNQCKKCGATIPIMLSRNNICDICLVNNKNKNDRQRNT